MARSRAGSASSAADQIFRDTLALVERGRDRERAGDDVAEGGAPIPRVPYGRFLHELKWEQGEHITEIGPTGYGKTTLAVDLLTRRDYVMVFGTKRTDATLDKLIARGYRRLQSFAERRPEDRRIIIWPDITRMESADEIYELQREAFRVALFAAFRQGGWCVYLDELRHITERLGLKSEVELLWEQGRSSDVSVVAGYQRPRNIPLLAYDQPEHLVFFKESDRENLTRMAEVVSWLDRRLLIDTIVSLRKYDFLYLYKPEERAVISRVER